MDIPCWGKSPKTGPCPHPATRFFVSLIPKMPGVTPANRAICDGCFQAYRFDHFVRHSAIKEVTQDEWLAAEAASGVSIGA